MALSRPPLNHRPEACRSGGGSLVPGRLAVSSRAATRPGRPLSVGRMEESDGQAQGPAAAPPHKSFGEGSVGCSRGMSEVQVERPDGMRKDEDDAGPSARSRIRSWDDGLCAVACVV